MNKTIPLVKLMVTIVDRGKRDTVIRILKEEHIHFHYLTFGLGTASSELLEYLGIGEPKKDVVLSLVSEERIQHALERLSYELHLERPGKGIVAILPLSGLSGAVCQAIGQQACEQVENGASNMENKQKYELVLAVINQGYEDQVMDAAKAAGATGGTVIHGRGIGHEEAEKFLGLSIQSEKEIVAILVPKEIKSAVMHEVSALAGLKTEAKGVLLALPVDSILGLN